MALPRSLGLDGLAVVLHLLLLFSYPWASSTSSSVPGSADEGFKAELLVVEPISGAERPEEQGIREFLARNMEPRHAVAVVVAGRGSKRHKLLEEVAADKDLSHLLALGISFAKGKTSLKVYRYMYDEEVYTGKWTRNAIQSWLQDVSYPPVYRMNQQFAPTKYLTNNPFGVVLVVKPLSEHSDALLKVLEPHAAKFRGRLKIALFTRAAGTTQLCDQYGVRTDNEILLLEKPQETFRGSRHSRAPLAPKHRMENLTLAGIDQFFVDYSAGTLPRYLTSPMSRQKHEQKLLADAAAGESLRELAGWDFVHTVEDPKSSVLVEFVSTNCESCNEFDEAYRQVARKIRELSLPQNSPWSNVIVARIDQSANEHTEFIKGTPWLKYWPRGLKKRPVDVELRSVESIMQFLEERTSAEIDEAKDSLSSTSRPKAGGGKTETKALPPQAKPSAPIVQLGQPSPTKSRGYLSTDSDLSEDSGLADDQEGEL
ncbi:unnamed protein product [Polarella glacialis]|uniref:Thioredoxin domain-containing protein n=1 Tax=Polarella glacialis TaxID=89957 RepID=A0A813FUK0_POLGL|nr:unnamed protein product [Polarella glacialis]